MTAKSKMVICPECDLLQRASPAPLGHKTLCARCDATLSVALPAGSMDRALALLIAAMLLFVIGQIYPVISMELQGVHNAALIWEGAWMLMQTGEPLVGALVLFTAVIFPLVQIIGLLLIVLPLRWGWTPAYLAWAYRLVERVRPWSMIEIFMLSVMVALVKLVHLATVIPGPGLWALLGLMGVLAWTLSTLDPEEVWARLQQQQQPEGKLHGCHGPRSATPQPEDAHQRGRSAAPPCPNTHNTPHISEASAQLPVFRRGAGQGARVPTALALGLCRCPVCGQCMRLPTLAAAACLSCTRCGSHVPSREPHSLQRTWALLLAAAVLYIPANLEPIMITRSIMGEQSDTILSGVIYLWQYGSWPLALLVFLASVAVPLLKLFALAYLLLTVQWCSGFDQKARLRLYRLLEFIGRWSMLDVFVVMLLVALVQIQFLANIEAGRGVMWFGAVVVLTMLAAMSFDPRLIWDADACHGP